MKRNLGIIAACLFMLTGPAQAARVWIEDVSIKDVYSYYEGGNTIVTVDFESASSPGTGCAPTDTHKIVSWWTGGSIPVSLQIWVSMLLSAQAQGLNVDIQIESSDCNTGSQWALFGSPYGLGSHFYGVRIRGGQ